MVLQGASDTMTGSSHTAPDTAAARVLIVEDDVHYADWIELALLDLGVGEIVKMADGAVALEHIENDAPFNLIICDWLMPNMDGLEFLRRFREKVATSMFLILTAKSGLEDVFEATQAGATNYIVKPVTIEELQKQVLRMLQYG